MTAQNLTIDEPVLLGDGPAMEWLRAAATRVAGGHAKVLITGTPAQARHDAPRELLTASLAGRTHAVARDSTWRRVVDPICERRT